jgi:hypothetical protein
MTDHTTLLALAERCEQAAEVDQKAVMLAVVDAFKLPSKQHYSIIRMIKVGAYESAAIALVPEGRAWTVVQNLHHWHWQASINALNDEGTPTSIGFGGPCGWPALALCAAALRARAAAHD